MSVDTILFLKYSFEFSTERINKYLFKVSALLGTEVDFLGVLRTFIKIFHIWTGPQVSSKVLQIFHTHSGIVILSGIARGALVLFERIVKG